MITAYIQSLKVLREKKGLSQHDIAKKLGISRTSFIAIEQGKKELSLSEARTLSNLFGVSLEDMQVGLLPNYEKYKEMILFYLRSANSKGDGKMPKTKLAKLLYLADFAWFYENLNSMSGMQYRHIQFGPVPDLYFRALDELESDGKINLDRTKDEVILIHESEGSKMRKLNALSSEEKSLIKKIERKWRSKRTSEIVNFTHEQLPYRLCVQDELIPYELIIQEDPTHVY
ncbi:MAG: type II toxin-antitoxin system antitoxin SocA domain-containing protein [Candidatus Komeilibacteria bacterium]